MGKITVTLIDEVEKQLRQYVTTNYPEQPFGKLSEIVNQAIMEFMAKKKKGN